MAASKWRRPPTKYDEDEEANGDSYLLFKLLDKDQSAYLDVKEVLNARRVVMQSVPGDTAFAEMMDGIVDNSDQNNDGKVIEEEWHDFLRSVYEVLGRKKWMEVTRAWRKTLSDEKAAEHEEQQVIQTSSTGKVGKKATNSKTAGQEDQPVVLKTSTSKMGKKGTSKTPSASDKDDAATKIQARFRGNKARADVAVKKAAGKSKGVHDYEKLQMAKEAGRHLITVISQDSEHGTRADFYLDGIEIEFTKAHGDLGRGLQVVTINPDTAKVVTRTTYDVTPPNVKTECGRMAADFKALPEGHFVLVANKAHGTKDLNLAAVAALRSVGATTEDFGKKEVSYALIGCKGCLASAERNGSTAEAEAFVSFASEQRAASIKDGKPRDLAP